MPRVPLAVRFRDRDRVFLWIGAGWASFWLYNRMFEPMPDTAFMGLVGLFFLVEIRELLHDIRDAVTPGGPV